MEEERYLKRQRIYKTIMLVVLTVFITFVLTTIYMTNKYDLDNKSSNILNLSDLLGENSTNSNLVDSLNYVEEVLEKYYLNDINEQDLIDGAISGMVEALGDAYTEYIPKEKMEEYTETLMGNYVGIGIYMIKNTEKNTIEVLTPIAESPAAEVGLLPGDTIISVDGVEYTGEQMTEAANKIKGEEGTTVKLEIQRGEEKISYEITRRKISTNPVIAKKLDNNIGYIQVTSFDEETSKHFKEKFDNLEEQGITSLIIDLRNNGGGLVNEALQMLDYIVPKGKELLITVDKDKKETIEKSKENVSIDMPIVVLVNENSASASEIFAGALKDLGEATIVGTKTYGKGVIQQFLSLRNGSGLKVTVEEYYTPNRTKINGAGIEPNEVVELPDTVTNVLSVKEEEDTQLQKAIEILK